MDQCLQVGKIRKELDDSLKMGNSVEQVSSDNDASGDKNQHQHQIHIVNLFFLAMVIYHQSAEQETNQADKGIAADAFSENMDKRVHKAILQYSSKASEKLAFEGK